MKLSNFKLKASTSNLDRILKEFNTQPSPYPPGLTVTDLIKRGANNSTDRAALVCGEHTVSYGEFYKRSNQMAAFLRNQEIQPETVVAVLLNHTIDAIIAIIAVLKSGGALLPLDPDTPVQRLKYMLEDAKARAVISEKTFISSINRLQWECPSLRTFLCIDSDNVHQEPEALNELMKEELWDYVGSTYNDPISGGGWFSSFSGDPFSKEEMDQYAQNILDKLTPYLNREARVLEIGCATGISMFPIAARVKEYHGVDLSREILANTRKEAEKRKAGNIKLSHLAAHEIDQLDDKDFDIVILNSVVQSFNGHNYLRDVIAKCINLMKTQAIFFFGDIQDLELKETLISDLMTYKKAHPEKGFKTKTDWSNELFLHRLFFEDLKCEFNEIQAVTASEKSGSIRNELTRYNYDVILEIDKSAASKTLRRPKTDKIKQQYGANALAFYRSTETGRAHEPSNLAYIIYTSGSTGAPKGVCVEHRCLADYIQTFLAITGLRQNDRVLQQVSFAFDASVEEIYPVLCAGGTLVLAADRKDLPGLLKHINKYAVTLVSTTPAVADYYGQFPEKLSGLETLISGGDVLKSESVRRVLERGNVQVYNTYGPTETTVCATYYPVKQVGPNFASAASLPLGKPIRNRQLLILNPDMGLLPVGIAGEICIGGAGIARGYLNNPRLSAEKFIPNPYLQGERLYRSGDKGKWLPDGNIEFLGRIDHQVKIRGYRIEPGEIEYHLLRHPVIKEAVVVAIESTDSDREGFSSKELAAYFITLPGQNHEQKKELGSKELRRFLGQVLTDYMIPSYFIQLDMLPLTPGGKIDKNMLPSPEGIELTPGADYTEPRNQLERDLVTIWEDVLNIKNISIHDNFFNLGGHSLKATRVVSRIQKELSAGINLKDIFTYQTIAQLSENMEITPQVPVSFIQLTEDREYYELSHAQRRLWVLDQFQEPGAGYSMPGAYWLKGRLNAAALELAFGTMIQRHESLRTCFRSIQGLPRQIVIPAQELDFSIKVEQPPLEQLEALIHGHGDKPFDLSQPPLFRVRVLKTAEEEHVLLFNMHHIISDAWSMMIFSSEFTHLYNVYSARPITGSRPLPGHGLHTPRIQYRDYAAWQNRYMLSEKGELQKEFWHRILADGGQYRPPEMPADFPRPPAKTYNGYTLEYTLPPEQSAELRMLCESSGATLFMSLLAALDILIHRYTYHEDIIIGSPIAGRDHPDLEDQIGFYVNTIALRNRVRSDDSFASLLERIKESTAESYQHQSYPFDKLVDELNLDRDPSRHPLFDIMLAVQNTEDKTPELNHLRAIPIDSPFSASKFDLTFNFVENNESGLPMEINYNTDLFKGSRIHRMLLHFSRLLEIVSREPQKPVKEIDFLPDTEKQQILERFNDTTREYPADKTLIDLFEDQVLKNPDRIALIDSVAAANDFNRTYRTYNQLHTDCHEFSLRLREEGIEPEDIVAMEVRRSSSGMAAILGIMKAGAIYLPLAPDAPKERTAYMLADSSARIIIKPGENEVYNISIVNTDWLMDISAPGGTQDCDPAGPCRPAYIMYTSGSTGHPKGVLVEHRSIVNTVWHYKNHCQLDKYSILLHQLSFTFDASLIALFGALISGSRMVLLSSAQQFELSAIQRILPRLGVTFFNSTPGFYHTMLKEIPEALTGLKTVVAGGEAPDRRMVERHFKLLPKVALLNDYGPTENSVLSTSYTCQPGDETANIPIGAPIANTRVFILDRYGMPRPIGISGEIYLVGPGLSRGYLNNPELTKERFHPAQPGNRSYKTGDLGRWREDGNIEFLGRADHQVKVLGYRIELEEIEFHLMTHPAVTSAAVITRLMDNKNQLAAFVVCSAEAEGLREHLEQYLPAYMVPRYITVLEQLPVTAHGKTDRKALETMALSDKERQTPYTPPRNKLEEQLVSIWQAVLEQKQIGIHDNFFELMGHSLKAIQVVSRIYKELSAELPLRTVFQKPTIAELASEIQVIRKKERSVPYAPIEAVEEREYYPLSSAQRRMWVLHQFENVRDAYNMPSVWELKGPLDINALDFAFRALMDRHQSLRTAFATVEGEPFQIIVPSKDLPFDLDISEAESGNHEQSIKEFISCPFDLGKAPLFKVKLLAAAENSFTLLFNMHHIISDGWSMNLFFNGLTELYNTVISPETAVGKDNLGGPLKIQYKDFAAWQNRAFQSGQYDGQKEYWLATLSGKTELAEKREIPVIDFPTDFPRPPAKSGQGSAIDFQMDESLSQRLIALSGQQKVTPFMILTALLNLLIYRYTGQENIFLGTPVAGRTHPDLENQIGLYINTLVLANRVNPHKEFQALLDEVKHTASNAFDNQIYPFDRLVDELEPDRDPSRHPLFDIMIVMQDGAAIKEGFQGIEVQPVDTSAIHCTSKFDLTFTFAVNDSQVYSTVTYSTSLFGRKRVRQVWWHFEQLLDSVFKFPDLPVKHLPILAEDEKKLLLTDLNATETAYPRGQTLVQLFQRQVSRRPDHIAVFSAAPAPSCLSYKELDGKSNQLAIYFKDSLGICTGDRVALRMPPGANLIVAILAALKSGAAFVPLDPDFPQERVEYILRDSNACVLIEQNWKISKINQTQPQTQTQNPSDGMLAKSNEVFPYSLAYVIYTSGSTGRPKGVAVEHRSMVNYTSWYIAEAGLGLSEDHRFLLTHSITFDAAFTNLFSALLTGSQLHLLGKGDYLDPVNLLNYISLHKITHLKFVPSLFAALVNALDTSDVNLEQLRFIMLGGEAIQPADVERFHRVWPQVLFMNHYGPTETTVGSVIQWLDLTSFDEYKQRPTIGNPIHNTGVFILDANLEPVPIGVKGELCIFGDGLARGYLNNPELTAERFPAAPIPYKQDSPQSIPKAESPLERGGPRSGGVCPNRNRTQVCIYKTGDLARWLPSGVIEFLGRADQQVKIRGYRVELDEISQVLCQHPAIKEAAILAPELDGRLVLNAYIVLEAVKTEEFSGKVNELPVRELRQHLSGQLPDYMIPSYFVSLPELPLTTNGKLDRKKLAKLEIRSQGLEPGAAAKKEQPGGDSEKLLTEIWSEILGVNDIGMDDNFFEKGGDSIKAIQVSASLHKRGLHLKISQLFSFPTIRQLAKCIGQAGAPLPQAEQGLIEGDIPLTPVQWQFFGQAWETNNHFNQDVMLFSKEGFEEDLVRQAFKALLLHHDALRMSYGLAEESGRASENIRVIQYNQAQKDPRLQMEVVPIDSESEEEIQKIVEEWANAIQSSLDITNGPLVQLGLFKTGAGDHLLFVIHHLVVDGISWRVLIEDFSTAYRQLEQGQQPQLPPKTTSFKKWAEKLEQYAASPAALRELEYWKEIILTPTQYLPKEKKIRKKHKIYKNTKKVTVEFTEEHTKLLLDVPGRGQSEVNDMLLSALMLACHDWARVDKIRVNLEGHGREEIMEGVDVSRTVGWFTSKYPVLLTMPPSATPLEQLDWTRKTLRSIPNKGVGYGILRDLSTSPETAVLKDAPEPEINFNYLGEFDLTTGQSQLELSSLPSGQPVNPERHFPFTLSIDGIVANNQMYLFFTYNILEYPAASVLELAEHFGAHLFQLAKAETNGALEPDETTKPLKDFLINDMTLLNREHVQNIFFFPPSIGLGLSYMTLAGKLGNCAFYAFDYIDRPGRILEYIDYITNIQPSGPYVLGSYSSGCLVFEVAKALEQLGKKVSGIVLLDAVPSDEYRAKVKLKTRELNKMIAMFLEHVKIAGGQGNKQTNDRLRRHALKHNEFIGSHPNTGKINAPLHYIKSSNTKDEYKNWEPLTAGKISLYEGSGKHHEMLFPGHLEVNAEIVRRIVDTLSRLKE